MAIVPLKQTVTIKRGTEGEYDEWGYEIPEQTFTLKCRIDEGSALTKYMSGGTSSGGTVTSNARFLFDKLADIRYTDEMTYVNELGITTSRKPKEINVKRNVAGKPTLTEVFV